MADTVVVFNAPSGMNLTLKLYKFNSDTIANGSSGDQATERTNNKGTYSAVVSESLGGWYHATIVDASNNVIAKYSVFMEDDTNEHYCQEYTDIDTDAITQEVVKSIVNEIQNIEVQPQVHVLGPCERDLAAMPQNLRRLR